MRKLWLTARPFDQVATPSQLRGTRSYDSFKPTRLVQPFDAIDYKRFNLPL